MYFSRIDPVYQPSRITTAIINLAKFTDQILNSIKIKIAI